MNISKTGSIHEDKNPPPYFRKKSQLNRKEQKVSEHFKKNTTEETPTIELSKEWKTMYMIVAPSRKHKFCYFRQLNPPPSPKARPEQKREKRRKGRDRKETKPKTNKKKRTGSTPSRLYTVTDIHEYYQDQHLN